MPSLVLGYFLSYIPYVMLTKALSSGILPEVDKPIGGFVLLPASALGQFVAMPIILGFTERWRDIRQRRIGGRCVMYFGRETLAAACFTAIVIGTTTLNFTFLGISILLMLLLMRAGVLLLAPTVDVIRRSKVHTVSWVALILSLAAVAVALGDVRNYVLTLGALLSLGAYFIGYFGRFQIMSRVAKTGVRHVDRRYFAEEHAAAPFFLVLLCVLGAAFGQPDLRTGFTSFLTSPAALYAFGIGILYEILFIFGTLIYLDVREYAWCVPANRCASLLSGLVGSFLLTLLAGLTPPGGAQLLALVLVFGAIAALSFPAFRAASGGVHPPPQRFVLFVCGGNRCRSVLAEAIAHAEIASARAGRLLTVASAGVNVSTLGRPMAAGAENALRERGIVPHRHRSTPLTRELCQRSDVIYCMANEHRAAVIAMAPDAAGRTYCLHDTVDIAEPVSVTPESYRHCTHRIQELVRSRLAQQPEPYRLAVEAT